MNGTNADSRRSSPAAARNAVAITNVLKDRLPGSGRVLEVASGTGQHAVAFAAAFPAIDFLTSDPNPASRDSILAWMSHAGLSNVTEPRDIDVAAADWAHDLDGSLDAVLAINLVHISPWSAAEGLIEGTARLLRPEGFLYVYGPYRRSGRHTAESNAAFDRSLRSQDPSWGVRDLEDIEALAGVHGLSVDEIVEMPANNLSLIIRRQ